ncbi:MAG: S-layer homology domain-containing protein [Clostridia bacterium]|nr:S-layer homology domain-containing protein [Clostridia bacterium]
MKRKNFFRAGALFAALVMGLSSAAFAAESTVSFKDVNEADYFLPAVQWGVEEGITTGVDAEHFDPRGIVTRAQAVTFLWRMQGEPAAANGQTFSDVKAGSWYEPAVKWAVEQGITQGTGDGKFSPEATLDRAMCMTLIYRMEGCPFDEAAAADPVEVDENSSLEEWGVSLLQQIIQIYRERDEIFPDVKEGAYYELPVIWGSMADIITEDNTGAMVDGVKFRPADPCVRSEMISFLYQTRIAEERKDGPEVIDLEKVQIPVPQNFSDQIFREYMALGDDEDGIFIRISEWASRQAAEALGEDPDETGAGELFAIGRVSEAEAKQIVVEDIGFAEVFAKDADGKYYVFYHPTDVRYVRENNEEMAADQDDWEALCEWVYGDLVQDILEYSDELTPVTMESLR